MPLPLEALHQVTYTRKGSHVMNAGISETLFEVATKLAAGENSSVAVGNFLAFLAPDQIPEAIDQEPELLAQVIPSGDVMDAYLGAVAETLANRVGIPQPPWAEAPGRFLGRFHFPSKNRRLNDLLLQETPEPFRRRGLVTSSNGMSVA